MAEDFQILRDAPIRVAEPLHLPYEAPVDRLQRELRPNVIWTAFCFMFGLSVGAATVAFLTEILFVKLIDVENHVWRLFVALFYLAAFFSFAFLTGKLFLHSPPIRPNRWLLLGYGLGVAIGCLLTGIYFSVPTR